MQIIETASFTAHPDAVWKVVGDVGAIASWIPAIESVRMDGDTRHATFAGGGGDAVERIVEHDDAGRSYLYEYLSGPLPLQEYRSRITVEAQDGGSRISWDATFTSGSAAGDEELATAIRGIYRDALDRLRQELGA
ncbi:SRPBCC family protein [Nocardia sp. NPDC057353]|uniref:SRPBCC family protein n=1 Tax=Nocardia sp. NPDC057353 TaxID=3346104 RepID=UPI0036450673